MLPRRASRHRSASSGGSMHARRRASQSASASRSKSRSSQRRRSRSSRAASSSSLPAGLAVRVAAPAVVRSLPLHGRAAQTLDDMPHGVKRHVLTYLSVSDLGRLAQVSRAWNKLASADGVWGPAYRAAFPHAGSVAFFRNKVLGTPMKELFRERVQTYPVWSVERPTTVGLMTPHARRVNALRLLTVAPNLAYIVTAGDDATLRIARYTNRSINRLATVRGHTGPVTFLHLTADLIVSGTPRGDVRVWRLDRSNDDARVALITTCRLCTAASSASLEPTPTPAALDDATASTPLLQQQKQPPLPSLRQSETEESDDTVSMTALAVSTVMATVVSGWSDGTLRAASTKDGCFLSKTAAHSSDHAVVDLRLFHMPSHLLPIPPSALPLRSRLAATPSCPPFGREDVCLYAVSAGANASVTIWNVTHCCVVRRIETFLSSQPMGLRVSVPTAMYSSPSSLDSVAPSAGLWDLHAPIVSQSLALASASRAAPATAAATAAAAAASVTASSPVASAASAVAVSAPATEPAAAEPAAAEPAALTPVVAEPVIGPGHVDPVITAVTAEGGDDNNGNDDNELEEPTPMTLALQEEQDAQLLQQLTQRRHAAARAETQNEVMIVVASVQPRRCVSVFRASTGAHHQDFPPESDTLPITGDPMVTAFEVWQRQVAVALSGTIGTVIYDLDTCERIYCVNYTTTPVLNPTIRSLQFDDAKIVTATGDHALVTIWPMKAMLADPSIQPRTFVKYGVSSRADVPLPMEYDDHKLAFVGHHAGNREDRIVVADFARAIPQPRGLWLQNHMPAWAWQNKGFIVNLAIWLFALTAFILLAIKCMYLHWRVPWTVPCSLLAFTGMLVTSSLFWLQLQLSDEAAVPPFNAALVIGTSVCMLCALPLTLAFKADGYVSYSWTLAMLPYLIVCGLNTIDSLKDLVRAIGNIRRGFVFSDQPFSNATSLIDHFGALTFAAHGILICLRADGIIAWSWWTVWTPNWISSGILVTQALLCCGLSLGYTKRHSWLAAGTAARLTSEFLDYNIVPMQMYAYSTVLLVTGGWSFIFEYGLVSALEHPHYRFRGVFTPVFIVFIVWGLINLVWGTVVWARHRALAAAEQEQQMIVEFGGLLDQAVAGAGGDDVAAPGAGDGGGDAAGGGGDDDDGNNDGNNNNNNNNNNVLINNNDAAPTPAG